MQLNGMRLDPLGLSHYEPETDQRDRVRPDRTTVVFFGDSRAASWPPPGLPQFDFVNRGINGETSVQALGRFDDHVGPLRPEIVVVQVGVNDLTTVAIWRGHYQAIVANCQENIRQIVARSRGLGAKVVLTTVFPNAAVPVELEPYWSDRVEQAIKEVNVYLRSLEGEHVVVLDAYGLLAGADGCVRPEYSQDLLHLEAAGYQRLNEALGPLLVAMTGG